jgi:hypothetical protein
MNKGSQFGHPSDSNQKFLVDHDCEIFEIVMSQFDPYELINISVIYLRICMIIYIYGSRTWVNS